MNRLDSTKKHSNSNNLDTRYGASTIPRDWDCNLGGYMHVNKHSMVRIDLFNLDPLVLTVKLVNTPSIPERMQFLRFDLSETLTFD